ncbi:MAG: hypothetical protein L6R40_000891 [Gallowayella cf. fulva]|nr:MAG: hypothetical protein L6R40_000891 [Xanthomendoza cf. fulva]
MSSKRVLLLGGHGKVSMLLTPLLVSRGWHVTSVIRDVSQKDDILSTVKNSFGKVEVDVLVSSLEDVKSKMDAQQVIEQSKPSCVVFSAGMLRSCVSMMSAGAGGKGGPSRTQAIDRDSCMHFIRATADTASITKFLLISYTGSRRTQAPWWTEEDWKGTQEVNNGVLKNYYPAKLASDECLTAIASRRIDVQAIVLRPGILTDEKGSGSVSLGKTKARGSVSREDVAAVAAELIDSEARGWFDLLEGTEPIANAVQRVIQDKVDCVEGEDVEGMIQREFGLGTRILPIQKLTFGSTTPPSPHYHLDASQPPIDCSAITPSHSSKPYLYHF